MTIDRDNARALIGETRDWRKTALPPTPWGDNHIAVRLADVLESALSAVPVEGDREALIEVIGEPEGHMTNAVHIVGKGWTDLPHYVRQEIADAILAAGFSRSPLPVEGEVEPKSRLVDKRDPECVKVWPGCASMEYDPRCCRFPKSCSAGGFEIEEVAP